MTALLDSGEKVAAFQKALLCWYDQFGRRLPWRAPPGVSPKPYYTWLSEIMLQQTTVSTVKPYFMKFLEKWPDIRALAAAPREEILAGWAGLGYYARARNLHACAKEVVSRYGGVFPATEKELRALPGIGPYTAAAVAAIAFERPVAVVDGNIERVLARLFSVQTPMPGAKKEISGFSWILAPGERPGDRAQALMDLGAGVCRPKNPLCESCPVRAFCLAWKKGLAGELPRREKKKNRPHRYGVAFRLWDPANRVLLVRRPDSGLLGGMTAFPATSFREARWTLEEARAHAPAAGRDETWLLHGENVQHVFTHFSLTLSVAEARLNTVPATGDFRPRDALKTAGLPVVMRKVARLSPFSS